MCPIHHLGRSGRENKDILLFITYRVKCFVWLEAGGGPFVGFGFASDISEAGAVVYLDLGFTKGSIVRIALEDETATGFRGIVVWSQRYTLGQNFIGHPVLDHRVGIHLRFETEAERQRFIMACNDIRRNVTALKNPSKF